MTTMQQFTQTDPLRTHWNLLKDRQYNKTIEKLPDISSRKTDASKAFERSKTNKKLHDPNFSLEFVKYD